MRTAVVVGAGVGGLAVAGALAHTGWRVTLLEREDRLRAGRAAALVLWPNGMRALGALGLGAGLQSFAVPPTGIRRPNGQWLLRPGTPGSVPDAAAPDGATGGETGGSAEGTDRPRLVYREDLHDSFMAGLGERVDVRTGVEIRTARPMRDRPAVSDGRTTYEADLVVAADGVDSVIRRRLAPATRFVSTGFAAWRAVIPWFRAPDLAGLAHFSETVGAGHRFSYGSAGEHRGISWAATVPGARRPEPPETQLGLLRRWFAGWHEPIPALLAATEPADLVHDAVGELEPMPESFAVGGYVLLGDAAHAMPHHLAQGASLAIEDAATLQHALAGPGLDEYNKTRRLRALRVLAHNRRAAAVLQARGRFLRGARLAPRTLERGAAAAADWFPPPVSR
jgi:2-polyprenyl-6-methoxyphenol hydroxylase-like FAD-dependent oxidoreductase